MSARVIASVFPLDRTFKPKNHMGIAEYRLTAATKGDVSLLVVEDAYTMEYRGKDAGIDGRGYEKSTLFVDDWIENLKGLMADRGYRGDAFDPRGHFGIWVTEILDASDQLIRVPTVDQVKASAQYKENVQAQSIIFMDLVRQADDWAASGKKGEILDIMVAAAGWLGLDRPWGSSTVPEALKSCPFCRKFIDAQAIKCPECSEVVDPRRHAELKKQLLATVAA